jgi:hypothetical protein
MSSAKLTITHNWRATIKKGGIAGKRQDEQYDLEAEGSSVYEPAASGHPDPCSLV